MLLQEVSVVELVTILGWKYRLDAPISLRGVCEICSTNHVASLDSFHVFFSLLFVLQGKYGEMEKFSTVFMATMFITAGMAVVRIALFHLI